MKDKEYKDESQYDQNFRKDFFWYFLSSFVPMLIGFVKTPIFTRNFSREEFGNLGLISITYTFLGMMLFSWIGSCIWRYFSKYQERGKLKTLFSNLFLLYVISFFLLGVISWFWYDYSSNTLHKQLIVYSFLQLLFNQLLLFYMVVIRLMGRSRFYTLFQSVRSITSFLIALILVFYFKMNIAALVSSLAIIDFILFISMVIVNPAGIRIGFASIEKKNVRELLRYGSVGLILNLSLLTITYSDRYIIALFCDMDAVGIYDQVYKLSQLSIMALVTVFFNTVNPVLLKVLEVDFKNSLQLINRYLFAFLLFGIPLVFYASVFSEELSQILLGKNFREGFVLMPFIFAATFLHGVSNFFELRLKFANKLKRLGIMAISTALLNIGLNLVFISTYGYEWAAYTTVISYIFMIGLLYSWDPQVLHGMSNRVADIAKVLVMLALQYGFYLFLVNKFDLIFVSRIMIGVIFVFIFYLSFRKIIHDAVVLK